MMKAAPDLESQPGSEFSFATLQVLAAIAMYVDAYKAEHGTPQHPHVFHVYTNLMLMVEGVEQISPVLGYPNLRMRQLAAAIEALKQSIETLKELKPCKSQSETRPLKSV